MTDNIYPQDKPFTIRGHWWLPDSDRRIAGDLVYKEKSVTLELYGGLNDAHVTSPLSAIPEAADFPVIHGDSLDGVPVTVLNSFYTRWKPDIRSLSIRPGTRTRLLSSRLCSNGMVTGVHMRSLADHFTKCRVEIPYLETWLSDSPFEVNTEDSFEEIHVDYSRPANEAFELPESKCVVRVVHSVRLPTPTSHTSSIIHRSYIDIEPFEPMSLKWFRDQCSQLVDLFSLFFGGNLQSRRLMLLAGTSNSYNTGMYYPRHKVEIPAYEPMDFVIRSVNVRPSLDVICDNWFSASDYTKQARSILLSCKRRPSSFIDRRFLPLVHAAEVLTKDIEGSTIIDKEAYRGVQESIVESLPNDLPEDLVERLKSAIRFANSHHLKHKLRTMLDQLQEETRSLFCVDKDAFVKGIVNTRNYYTHYSATPKILQDAELHWAICKTSLMLRVLLLLKAGLSEDDLQSMIGKHLRLRQEKAVWSKLTEEGSPFKHA